MLIVAVAWIFVVLLMSLAEAISSQGSVLGALVTFVLYGVLPLAIVLYLMGTPMRRRALRAREAAAVQAEDANVSTPPSLPAEPATAPPMASAGTGHRRGHAAGDAVTAERKEP